MILNRMMVTALKTHLDSVLGISVSNLLSAIKIENAHDPVTHPLCRYLLCRDI